jgi:nucleotide-binding universal stress UspA family protein
MALYDRILVPTDGSEVSEAAAEHAVALAAEHGATLHVVYVVDTASVAGLTPDATWEGVSDLLYREGESALDAVREMAEERGVPVETTYAEGTPAREIVRYAEREGCDVVVMGTHGRGGIDRLLLGSVAERVVRSCSVPVLTVRAGD